VGAAAASAAAVGFQSSGCSYKPGDSPNDSCSWQHSRLPLGCWCKPSEAVCFCSLAAEFREWRSVQLGRKLDTAAGSVR
jgi:hypothetical protein